jgi:hypothetical protein
MTMPTAEDEMPLSVWLRQQREARGWGRREQGRRLIQAGREAGDTSMPSVDGMYHNIHRWERGDNEPTERYKLYLLQDPRDSRRRVRRRGTQQ